MTSTENWYFLLWNSIPAINSHSKPQFVQLIILGKNYDFSLIFTAFSWIMFPLKWMCSETDFKNECTAQCERKASTKYDKLCKD